ncbi:hypothetical protein [Nocardia sp. NPDC052566]|uniref:hypothetical protein n=1 Tax=Nocardia sp. NPDC052566 TaxID=3364330 RepID=UPI0037CC6D8F
MFDDFTSWEFDLLVEIRRIGATKRAAVDAALDVVDEQERAALAGQLIRVAAQVATPRQNARALPPPGTAPGIGAESIDLSAQLTAVPVAQMFVRNTLRRWWWDHMTPVAECVVEELAMQFVTVLHQHELAVPTRMTIRIRALEGGHLVIEVHDSPENAHLFAQAGPLTTARIERLATRCGQCHNGGRTVVWCELAATDLSAW